MLGFGLLIHTAPAGMRGTENINCASQGHVVCLVCQQRMFGDLKARDADVQNKNTEGGA